MKQFFILLLVVMLLLAVPSVFAKGAEDSGSSQNKPVTLTWLILEFWNPDSVIAAYQETHPHVTIEAEKVGWGDFFQQNQIRLMSGEGDPDIVSIDVPLVASYGSRGWLAPLDGTISSADKKTWIEAAVDASMFNGQLLAVPQHTSTQLLFVNYDLLEAQGLTPPGVDDRWTWEQVLSVAQTVTHDDRWGFNWEQNNAIYQLQPLPVSLGGKVIGSDGFTVDGVINSEEWVEAFTFYGDVYNKYSVAPKGDIPAADLFAAGKLAMFVGGPWNIRRLAADALSFDWAVSRHPYFEGGDIVTPTGSWHFGVNANSDALEESAAFVRWLTAGDGAQIWWSKDSYDMPAHVAFLESFKTAEDFQTPPLSYMQTAAKEAQINPVPRPVTPGFLEYDQLLQAAFSDIRNGADPQTTLDTAVTRITSEMAKYQ